MIERLFDKTLVPFLEKGLNLLALRHKAIAFNIANITTPDFSRMEVPFETELKKAVAAKSIRGTSTNVKHISIEASNIKNTQPKVRRVKTANNVDIEHEMAELAKNQILYNVCARLMARQFKDLKTSISGRTR